MSKQRMAESFREFGGGKVVKNSKSALRDFPGSESIKAHYAVYRARDEL